MSYPYTVHIDYTEFREYLVENDDAGPWGDTYFHEVFDKYVEDNSIEIEYTYGTVNKGKTTILWRLADTEGCQIDELTGKPMNFHKVYQLRYGGSSHFAMWWCGLTDDIEDEVERNSEELMCICCPHKYAINTYGKNNDPLCKECKEEQEYCSCGIKQVDCEICGESE